MRTGKVWSNIVLAIALSSGAAHAKDWGDILLKKGLITPQELKRTRKEIEQSQQAEKKNEAQPVPPYPRPLSKHLRHPACPVCSSSSSSRP